MKYWIGIILLFAFLTSCNKHSAQWTALSEVEAVDLLFKKSSVSVKC